MNMKNSVLIACACGIGVLSGVGFEKMRTGRIQETPPAPAALTPATDRAKTDDDDSAALSAAALRRRVAELERALAQQQNESRRRPAVTEITTEGETPEPAAREGRWERGGRGERGERANREPESPERVAERQQRREEMRQQFEQLQNDRMGFLLSVDTSSMNAAQRDNHTKLLQTLERINGLSELMNQGGEANVDRGEIFREMAESTMELSELYDNEREYLLESTAKAVGYSGAEVTEFAAHLKAIFDHTSLMPPSMMGGRRGGGGGFFRR